MSASAISSGLFMKATCCYKEMLQLEAVLLCERGPK